MTTAEFGRASELAVYRWLKGFNIDCELVPFNRKEKYDMVANGKRIEIKSAKPRIRTSTHKSLTWTFNLHRHNILDESQVDLYIFRMEDVPHSHAAIHLVVPAPLNKKNVFISVRAMLTKWGKFYNRFDLLLPDIKT